MAHKGDELLKRTFLAFRDQCIWLQICFTDYSDLYESGEETRSVMSQSAPAFFGDLNSILIEYCILQMCRLTDPAESMGRGNLTISHINNLLKSKGQLTSQISALSEEIDRYRKLIVLSRNRVISHADKDTLVEFHSNPALTVGEFDHSETGNFFSNLYEYVNRVGEALGVGPLDFSGMSCEGDSLDLIRILKAGLNSSNGKYHENHQ